MTNASRIEILNRLKDMRETTQIQKGELQKEIQNKNQKLVDIKSNSKDKHGLFSDMLGLSALIQIVERVRRKRILKDIQKAIESNFELNKKEHLVNNLYEQVKERLDIIHKAKTNDLEDFLKENDVYSIFEKGKFEEFTNNKENKESNTNETSNDKNSNESDKQSKKESDEQDILKESNTNSNYVKEKEDKKPQREVEHGRER